MISQIEILLVLHEYTSSICTDLLQITLVDDSTSMRNHWADVEQCGTVLAHYTAPYDKDGIDLRFMMSEATCHTKKTDSVGKVIRDNKPPARQPGSEEMANINSSLVSVLGEYQDAVHAKYGNSKSRSLLSSKVKKLVIFILTDGLWEDDSDAEGPIRQLVATLRRCNRPDNQVGIQFIRFGNDSIGMERLQYLDDFLEDP